MSAANATSLKLKELPPRVRAALKRGQPGRCGTPARSGRRLDGVFPIGNTPADGRPFRWGLYKIPRAIKKRSRIRQGFGNQIQRFPCHTRPS